MKRNKMNERKILKRTNKIVVRIVFWVNSLQTESSKRNDDVLKVKKI